MEKPNLLYISPITPTPTGIGLAKRAYHNLKALAAYHSIFLLIIPLGIRDCSPHPSLFQLCEKQQRIGIHPVKDVMLLIKLLILKIRRQFLPGSIQQSVEYHGISPGRLRRAVRIFSGIQFHTVHVFRLYMVPWAEPFLRDFGGVVQLDLDDIESLTRKELSNLYRKNKKPRLADRAAKEAVVYARLETEWLSRFDRIFVCSEKDKEFIHRHYHCREIRVVSNIVPVPSKKEVKIKADSRFHFLLCANFHYYPNLDALFYFYEKILPLMRRGNERLFHVDVVGPGLPRRVKRQLSHLPEISYWGRVPDVTQFYKNAHAALVPIRAGGGTRIKVLEALAYHTPVVSTIKGVEGLPVLHDRHVLLANNANSFANHCHRLMEDTVLGKRLVIRAHRLLVKRYTLEHVTDELCRDSHRIVGGYPHGSSVDERIDVVYTWVDSREPTFQKALQMEQNRLSPAPSSIFMHRFRDNQELRYSLRGLETFAPWTGHIYIVTNGQVPPWLNQDHPRISIVNQESIFKDRRNLPTFNSNAIELQLHRIPKLSKRFLYFNDDIFLGRNTVENEFMKSDGKTQVYLEPIYISAHPTSGSVLSRSYAYTQRIVEETWGKKSKRYLPAHTAQLYDREILARLEDKLGAEFRKTSSHRFRAPDDLVLRILYYYYLLESEECAEMRPRIKLLRWGSEDYSFLMLEPKYLKMAGSFLHLLRTRPRFFCINDDMGAVSDRHPILVSFRLFLRLFFPRSSSFEK